MIPQETVNKILDVAQIEDVVGEFVSLKRRGANYTACCPFHNEKTPSFYVSPSKGIYKCFGCGKSGTAVGFVMEHESLSYVEALKFLARKYHIEVVEKEETAEDIALRQRNESLLAVSEFAAQFYKGQLKAQEGRAVGHAYFKARGLEDATVEKFGLGWAPSTRAAFSKAAREAGYKEEFLVDTGLSVRRDDGSLSDRFYDRAMFPIHSVSGRVIAFGGRTLKTDKSVAKYVNSPETEIYVKSRSLYGIYFAKNEISRQGKCLLVEGYLDVISMHQLGISNVVASSGTSLTVEQIRLIKKFTENVTIIYDGDSAGIHAALRGIDLVLKEGLNVKIVLLPDGDDPDSYARKHDREEVEEFIAGHEQDFISFKTDLLLGEAGDDPLKKANLINDIADTIAVIPDAVKRSMYVESCSEKFRIEAQILFDRIGSMRDAMLIADKRQREREAQRTAARTETRPLPADMPEDFQPVPEDYVESLEVPVERGLEDVLLAPSEKELLGFVLNNGQSVLQFDVDSEFYSAEPVMVADFIDSALAADDEDFVNGIYHRTYEKYFSLFKEGLGQELIVRRMMDDDDRAVAEVVADLVVPKYDLTVDNYRKSMTVESTQIVTFVPKSILAYKIKRIEKEIKRLSDSLATLEEGDTAGVEEVMLRLKELYGTKNMLNDKLGRGFNRNK